jgi:nucleoside-specific outer membrane channel protein Tsx
VNIQAFLKRNTLLKTATLSTMMALALASNTATAGGTAIWSTTAAEYLYGTSYRDIATGDKDKASIITLEHADGWKYGDNFFFVDITNPDRQGDTADFAGANAKSTGEYYAELSPRLSFGKILGKDLSIGPFSDFLFTSTLEIPQFSSGSEQTYLYGLAADLKMPQFAFFQINLYLRDNQAAALGDGYQVTLAWGIPFDIGATKFSFEGFFDYAWDQKGLADNIISAPRFLVDLGNWFGKPGCIQAGVEWQFWHNKFGLDNAIFNPSKTSDESVPQAMFKWILN